MLHIETTCDVTAVFVITFFNMDCPYLVKSNDPTAALITFFMVRIRYIASVLFLFCVRLRFRNKEMTKENYVSH